ncbi:MAG: hypothetical protein HZB26_25700 [Candidatus Hydrogenedentes bacterium]|nr:hypothetical protein [Candidatus Hydrogenedentota bacterium]
MNTRKCLYFSLLMAAVVLGGCARAARDTTGFAVVNKATVNAPLKETWQAAKAVLREKELDLYTRDKRGVLVAYTNMRRSLLVPNRVQYTLTLLETSGTTTDITIETVRQVYGVTLLTYPGWHDRKTTDDSAAQEILSAVESKLCSTDSPPPATAPSSPENKS